MASYGGRFFCDYDGEREGGREIIVMRGEDRSLCLSSGQGGGGFWDFCVIFMSSPVERQCECECVCRKHSVPLLVSG